MEPLSSSLIIAALILGIGAILHGVRDDELKNERLTGGSTVLRELRKEYEWFTLLLEVFSSCRPRRRV